MRRLSVIFRMPYALLLVLLLALGLRLALWSQPLHQPANDEVEYVTVAYDLLAGRGWEFYTSYHWLRAPLYPLWLAGSLWLARGNLYLAALPNLLLSVANVYLIYRLTREVLLAFQPPPPTAQRAGYSAPLLAALGAALLFTFNTFASLYMSETLFTFCFTAALVALIHWKRQSAERRTQKRRLLVLAGVLMGMTILTRSLPLLFMPVVLLWMLLTPGGTTAGEAQPVTVRQHIAGLFRRNALLNALIFGVAVALPIAPWTLRNCLAYEQCVLVETGLSYNLWAFNEPHEDQATIFRTLEQIPDPTVRAAEATERGLERLREDPAILLRKLWPNWVHLWRVKIIQDRFLLADYSSDPPPLVFLGSLLLDDLLYVVILVAGVVGICRALAQRHLVALLLALWIAYVIAITLLTHGESRYRHFVFPVLLPFAALQMTHFRTQFAGTKQPLAFIPRLLAPLLVGLLLYTFVISYPWQWAVEGAARSSHRLVGNIALSRGDLDAAAAAYERALAADSTPDGWIALGDVRRQQGDLAGTEAAYRRAWRNELDHIAASARVGDLLREQGRDDAAREAFIGRYVDEQDVVDWSWTYLDPVPTARIDVGEGLDFGYVGGVYPAEFLQDTRARWTSGHARFRLALPAATTSIEQPVLLRMRLAAPRPDDAPVTVQVCVADACQPVTLDATWQHITLRLPPATTSRRVVELHSPTFAAPDGRELGVLVDWVALDWGVPVSTHIR
jgi:tetratricopeptide (TPR) repeat protein